MARIMEIEDFMAPELDVYARLTENQLVNRQEPANAMFIAESPVVIERALDAGYEPVSLLMERRHVDNQAKTVIERCGDVPVYTSTLDVLTQLTGFKLTRGVLCAMRRRPTPSAEDICRGARRKHACERYPGYHTEQAADRRTAERAGKAIAGWRYYPHKSVWSVHSSVLRGLRTGS